ncbi:MAG: MFS transporter [Oscillospiraceae bacterium]
MSNAILKQESQTKKTMSLIMGLLIMLCTGILYMWSVFLPYVVKEFGWATGDVGMTSSIMMAAFVLGNIISGLVQSKVPARIITCVTCVGCVVFAAGMYLTSLLKGGAPWMIYLTYGVLSGIGCGIAYNTVIAVLQKWFVSRRGLITGLAVGTFGAATVILSPIVNNLLETSGVSNTFMILSFAFLIVGGFASFFVSQPPVEHYMRATAAANDSTGAKQYTPREMVKTPMFYLLILSLFASTAPYMVIVPYIKTIAVDRGVSEGLALATVMITGIANASGRLICPVLSDKLRMSWIVIGYSIVASLSCILMIFARGPVYMITVFLIAFTYGGGSGINPVMSTELFGAKHSGVNYGIVLIGLAVSSITMGKIASAVGSTSTEGFSIVFVICAIVALIPIVAMMILRKICKKYGKDF